MLRLTLSALLSCLLPLCLPAQASKRVALVSHLTYPVELNDIWGWVDSTGREYALVGRTDGVSIVDLADPAQPVEVQFVPGANSVWRDLKTWGHHAYVTNETGNGLLIIDLSGLPGAVSYRDTVLGGVETAHNAWVDEIGYLYLAGPNNFNGGVAIFDLQPDPALPAFVGSYDLRYVHDLYVRGNRAYLGEILNGRLTILDVSDRSDPEVIGSLNYPGGFTHNTWLNDAGDVCFTTDELSGAPLIAWDVSDPEDIRELDRIRSSLSAGQAAPHNVHVFDDFLVTSYYRDGLHIVDASRPQNLVEVGYYDTSPLSGGGLSGAWGAYPFLPSGLVLVTDMQEGLFVLEVDYQRGAYLEGQVTDAVTGAPIGQVPLTLLGAGEATRSETSGHYALGVPDSGTYQLAVAQYGYLPDTVTVTLVPGQLTVQDLVLQPLPRIDLEVRVREAGSLLPIADALIQANVPDTTLAFSFLTGSDGRALASRFVINSYQFWVGKWGYRTREIVFSVDSTQPVLEVLLDPGYYDDFALDFGWTVSGTAQRGHWQRGEPQGTYETVLGLGIQNPEFDLPDDVGDAAYVTGNEGGEAFGFDVDNGFTWLVSPPIDLRRYTYPRINFWYWFMNWSLRNGGRPGNDFLRVSLTDGQDTFAVREYVGPFDTLWQEASVTVGHYFPADRDIRVLFYTQDLEPGNQDGVEAGIDGFRVLEGFPLAQDPAAETRFWVSPLGAGQVRLGYPGQPVGAALRITLHDAAGRQVAARAVPDSGAFTWAPGLPAGLYLARLWREGVPQAGVRFRLE